MTPRRRRADQDFAREYRLEHPLALWLSVGLALAGAASLVWPSIAKASPVVAALPEWLRIVFYVVWIIGGTGSAVGLWRARFDLEAAGMALLSGSLAAYLATILYIADPPIGSVLFLVALAGGCAQRTVHLVRLGRGH